MSTQHTGQMTEINQAIYEKKTDFKLVKTLTLKKT